MEGLGREMAWDDEIEKEGDDFEPLPEGTYDFTVVSMERARFAGSEKTAACNMAKLDLLVKSAEGIERHIYENLLLNSKFEWKLGQFFLCIGQKKENEKLKPNWNAVPGSTGEAEVYIDEYTKNGKKYKNNKINKFLPPEKKAFTAGKF